MREKREKTIKGKKNKNILPGAIALGLLLSVIVYAVMLNVEKNALSDYKRGTVVVATADIPAGQLITAENVSQYFAIKEMDIKMISDAAVTSMEQMNQLAAVYSIDEGTIVTTGMFEKLKDVLKDMKEPVIAGFKADDLYQVVGGVLRAGDRIHIYSVSEENEAELNWSDIYVQGVFDQSGTSIGNSDNTTAAQRINIYLDKKDVEEFYSNLAAGTLRVVRIAD